MTILGVAAYLLSPGADIAPDPAMRQLDLLYLDEPAPVLRQLGVEPGRPQWSFSAPAGVTFPQSKARRCCVPGTRCWPRGTP